MRGGAANLRRSAFTIIEVIVVCIIIAILATLVVPRFAGFSARRAEASVREFAELVSLAAAKDQVTSRGVALEYDGSKGTLRIMTLSTAASQLALGGQWQQDPLSRPVQLDDARVVSIASDGIEQDPGRWRIEFPRSEPRPKLSIVLEANEGGARYGVVLSSGAMRASIVDAAVVGESSDVIDLDASGKAGATW